MYKIKQNPLDFKVTEIMDIVKNEKGNQFYFLMDKINLTTLQAIKIIANYFNISLKNIGYAGLKDKKAVTKQYISIFLSENNFLNYKDFNHEQLKLEYIGRGTKSIGIGDLKANYFEITAREINEMHEKIYLDETINYFDKQRFSRVNVEIGKCIVKRQFKKACEYILSDVTYRGLIRKHLEKAKNDYVGALRKIDRTLLKLFIHAYQSYMWNKGVSEYIKIKYDKHLTQKYDYGKFCFPETEKIENIEIPLIGFDFDLSRIKDEKLKKIYEKIMLEEQLSSRDFIIRELPDISCEGVDRNLVSKIIDFNMFFDKDELNPGKYKCVMSFFLNKGCYATIAVRNIMLFIFSNAF